MNLFAAVHATWSGAALVAPRRAPRMRCSPRRCWTGSSTTLARRATVVVAGDRLSPALHDRAVAAGLRVHHYYGAAELSFVAWGGHADDLRPSPASRREVRDGRDLGAVALRLHAVRRPARPAAPRPRRLRHRRLTAGGSRGRLAVDGRADAVTTGGADGAGGRRGGRLRGPRRPARSSCVGVPHDGSARSLAAVLTDAARPDPSRRGRPAALDPAPAAAPGTSPGCRSPPAGKVDRAPLVRSARPAATARARRLA